MGTARKGGQKWVEEVAIRSREIFLGITTVRFTLNPAHTRQVINKNAFWGV